MYEITPQSQLKLTLINGKIIWCLGKEWDTRVAHDYGSNFHIITKKRTSPKEEWTETIIIPVTSIVTLEVLPEVERSRDE